MMLIFVILFLLIAIPYYYTAKVFKLINFILINRQNAEKPDKLAFSEIVHRLQFTFVEK